MVTQVTDDKFQTEVLESKTPVLVDFYATWCGPCRVLSPLVEQLAKDYQGKLKVVKLDVDEAHETAAKFGIMSVPTVVIFKNGKEAQRIVGAVPKDVLVKNIQQVVT